MQGLNNMKLTFKLRFLFLKVLYSTSLSAIVRLEKYLHSIELEALETAEALELVDEFELAEEGGVCIAFLFIYLLWRKKEKKCQLLR